MTLIPYNQNIPGSQNNPSDDQPLMRANTNSIRDWVQIDHHGFKDNLGGYHTIIHQDTSTRTIAPPGRTITGEPGAIPGPPGINQLFSMLVTPDAVGATADTQLFALTAGSVANNGLSQLTGNFSSVEGYQWLGGVLIQWGTVTVNFPVAPTAPATNPVIFKNRQASLCIPFPNSLFSVTATPFRAVVGPAGQATVSITTPFGGTEFNYVVSATIAGFTGFYWMAIGN